MVATVAIITCIYANSDKFVLSIKEALIIYMWLYDTYSIKNIQATADFLMPVYQQNRKYHGYVSLEISSCVANDTEIMIAEARRLWQEVNRPNLMINIPATTTGIPVIKKLISEGINVGVTLLFFQKTYEQVAEAYISGLEAFAASNRGNVNNVASVATFYISRIDTAIDNLIIANLKITESEEKYKQLKSRLSQDVIANAKLIYESYHQIYQSERWQQLAQYGAQSQYLLWRNTNTETLQNLDIDIFCLENLINNVDTVNDYKNVAEIAIVSKTHSSSMVTYNKSSHKLG